VLATSRGENYTHSMSEITIQGGHTNPYVDFMRWHLADAARPAANDQDPAVVRRCPEVLRQVLSLIWRFTPLEEVDVAGDKESYTASHVTTPEVGYATPEGRRGLIRLNAFFGVLAISEGVPEFDLVNSSVGLHGRAAEEEESEDPWIDLDDSGIHRRTNLGVRAGSMADLNYLQTLISKFQDAAFPREGNPRR
jgi:hypothetical protein